MRQAYHTVAEENPPRPAGPDVLPPEPIEEPPLPPPPGGDVPDMPIPNPIAL